MSLRLSAAVGDDSNFRAEIIKPVCTIKENENRPAGAGKPMGKAERAILSVPEDPYPDRVTADFAEAIR